MISRSETADFTKQETADNNNNKPSSSSSITTSWSRLKDPRIVRVSRAFGGKDRHSKVCTVRGLRDRRVRLSVPTAIQLYDLQDRLGLNQPSKVVDWLLNAAKTEIDDLPPLQFPQGSFSASLLPILTATTPNSKQALIGKSSHDEEEGRHGFNLGINQESSYDQNPSPSASSSSSLMNSCSNPFNNNSFVRWDPSSSLTLSHPPPPPPRSPSSPPHQGEDWHNFSMQGPMQSHYHHHHHHQVLVYQPTQTYFQSQIAAAFNSKEEIGFQSPAEPSTRPVHFNLLPSQNNNDGT